VVPAKPKRRGVFEVEKWMMMKIKEVGGVVSKAMEELYLRSLPEERVGEGGGGRGSDGDEEDEDDCEGWWCNGGGDSVV